MEKVFVLTICVHYRNKEEIFYFVNELLAQKNYDDQKVIIVDNSGDLDNHSILAHLYNDKRVIIYNPKKNLGYYGGAWWGMQQYLKEFPLPDWIIVCNTDIHFPDSNFFVKLLSYYEENPPSIVAPNIILESSGWLPSSYKYQNPHLINRPSKIRMHLYKWITRYYPIYISYEILSSLRYKIINTLMHNLAQKHSNTQCNKLINIYAPFGAFIIFNRSYFESDGTLDHGNLIFGEEIFVAETAYRLNLKVVFDPRLTVIHREHSSIAFLKSKQRAFYAREAAAYCADTFFKGTN